MNQIDSRKLSRVGKLLLDNRSESDGLVWPWLSDFIGIEIDKKSANKFFLFCILDYRMNTEKVWENARKLSDTILGNPDDLWGTITQISEYEWMSKFKEYKIHRFPDAHKRVWRIGNDIVKYYDSDVRYIWRGKSPSIILEELKKMKVGDKISNMCVGALIDTKQIDGSGDIKADVHVKKVLGRVIKGEPLTDKESIEYTRKMYPKNPWLLDRELYSIGREKCLNNECFCDNCYLKKECEYTKTLIPYDVG
jgi:endonuclease III